MSLMMKTHIISLVKSDKTKKLTIEKLKNETVY